MSLAFFYLVIGDLITFHQKAIFNFDAFENQPANKPDKGDKAYLFKVKDKKDRILVKYLTFVSDNFEVADIIQVLDESNYDFCFTKEINFNPELSTLYFRGPPSR